MKPLVSVIMPTYNGARFIERSIKSVLLQTMQNFELIIINDVSPDNTEHIVKQFDDSRIIYIKKIGPHQKSGENPRNAGMKIACGKYLSYLDHDDTYKLRFLEIMSAYLENHLDIDLAFCDCIWHRNLNGRGEVVSRAFSFDFDMKLMKQRNIVAVLTVMHRQEIINKIGYFQPGGGRRYSHPDVPYAGQGDWDYWFRIAQHFKMKHIPITLTDKIHKTSDNYWDKDFAPYLMKESSER